MLITNKDGSVTGEHQQLFPTTSFPVTGPTDAWLEKNGFARVPKSAEESAAEVRAERDQLLSKTDWMALSDNSITAEWAAYRQALRDITNQSGFPHTVLWPTKPQ